MIPYSHVQEWEGVNKSNTQNARQNLLIEPFKLNT